MLNFITNNLLKKYEYAKYIFITYDPCVRSTVPKYGIGQVYISS